MKFDRKQFFDRYRQSFGNLSQPQVDGLNFLLGKLEKDSFSVEQAAYVLATVKHETDHTFQPVREKRARVGTRLRATQDRYWGTGAYGRGYVQVTWPENYADFGLTRREDYDKALQPEKAYEILSRGMRQGKFTKYKLADFVNGEVDYVNARKVVNGLDKANQIAEIAQKFERILKASLVTETAKEPAASELVKDIQATSEQPPPSELPIEETKEEKVTVQKVAQSLGSKVMAGGALVGSIGSALLGAFIGIIKNPYAFAIIIVGGAFIAVYAWNKSKDRQAMLQMDLNAKAASKDLNTVVIAPPPPNS